MQRNSRRRIFTYDIKQGWYANLWKFIMGLMPFIGVVLIASKIEISTAHSPSFFDCIFFLFKGIKIYKPSQGSQFEIPALWMAVQVFTGMIVYSYPKDNFEKYGAQSLIRVKNKMKWWVSKYIWTVVNVILYYIAGYLTIFTVNSFINGNSILPDGLWNLLVNEIEISNITVIDLWTAGILIPVLTSISLSVLQMSLSFIFNPVYSFVMIMAYLTVSVYYYNLCFIASNSMILRNQIGGGGGRTCTEIVTVDIVVALVSGIVGYRRFRNLDVIPKSV